MMRGTPKEPTGTTKTNKKKPSAKKKSSEDSGKSSNVVQSKNKDSDAVKKVKKPMKAKTPAP